MAIHIGEKIKEIIEKRGMGKSELARRLNMSSTNVHKIFKRETIDTGLLENISLLLEHNFFDYYVSNLPIFIVQNSINNESSLLLQNERNSEIESIREKIKVLEKKIDKLD